MILTAYDPRVNPAARLLVEQASHACKLLVQLLRTADAEEATAEDYTKNCETMHGERETRTYRALGAPGQLVFVRADRYV